MRAAARLAVTALLTLGGCMPRLDAGQRATTFVVGQALPPATLDPAVFAQTGEQPIQAQIYEQLVALDPDAPGDVRGALARRWTVSPDGLTIDFELQGGHRFSDGTQVDAAAVVFSLDRVKRVARSSAGYIEWLSSVEATGPLTVRMHLKRPYAPAVQMLAQEATSIVSPAAVAAHDHGDHATAWLATHSAGSGPYQLAGLDGSAALLTVNPYATTRPLRFTRAQYLFLADEGVRRLMLERGDIDLVDNVSAAFVERYRALPGVRVGLMGAGPSLSYLTLNTAKGPLKDARLRRAIAASIDDEGLVRDVLKGHASAIRGFLPPGAPGADDAGPPPRRDLALARRLMAQAGYHGQPLTLVIVLLGPVGEFVQGNLREAGFNVALERRSPGAVDALERKGDFDMIYDGWLTDTPDPASMMESIFYSGNIGVGSNTSALADKELDDLIAQAVARTDPVAHAALLRRIDGRLRALQPLVMLFAAEPVVAYRRDVVGLRLNRLRPFIIRIAGLSRAPAAPSRSSP